MNLSGCRNSHPLFVVCIHSTLLLCFKRNKMHIINHSAFRVAYTISFILTVAKITKTLTAIVKLKSLTREPLNHNVILRNSFRCSGQQMFLAMLTARVVLSQLLLQRVVENNLNQNHSPIFALQKIIWLQFHFVLNTNTV